MYDYIIVGAGIVGLSVGMHLSKTDPQKKILILDKENDIAKHQTGRNSGVIHSGIYYEPGSFKARFAKEGSQSLINFCDKHDVEYDICGKVIVATNEQERPLLENLYQRGLQNGLAIEKLSQDELLEIEPHVNGIEAINVPQAGIVDYTAVSRKFAQIIKEHGGEIICGEEVKYIDELAHEVVIETNKHTYHGQFLINCSGLQSDRIARLAGYHTDIKIIPFRGEYFGLKDEKKHLVRNLIYPVPNPDFPFLGVHFTRMMNGEITAGPNAVLSFKREGYKKTDIHMKDLFEVLTYKGFIQLASKYMKVGLEEMTRSFSKEKFVESLQKLVPEIQKDDLIPYPAGVRAQALRNDGTLVDDFQIIQGKRSTHVCNAPSPAATASIEIGKEVVKQITERTVMQ